MVRCYKRKTTKGVGGAYSSDDLNKALQSIRNGEQTLSKASTHFKIPKSTLQLKLKGWKTRKPSGERRGRSPALAKNTELTLANSIKVMCQWGFGLTRNELMDLVQQYVKANNITTPFKDGRPGEDWFLNFKKRYNLSIKIPEKLEAARSRQTDPFIVYDFYDKLESIMAELNLYDKPGSVWNCDETSMNHDPSSVKVISERGKQATRQTAGSGRDATTALAAVSAAGQKMPPLILFKGQKMWDAWMSSEAYPNTCYFVAPNGWMTTDVFFPWFKHQFLVHSTERPLLLVYDGHLSHVSPQLINLAIEEHVHILKLPPHTTHKLQPLDVTAFKALKTKWNALLATWQKTHYGCTLSKCEFSRLLGKAWNSITPDIIMHGFRKTGIYDASLLKKVNRDAIPKTDFDPSQLRRYEEYKRLAANNVEQQARSSPLQSDEENGSAIEGVTARHESNLPSELPSTSGQRSCESPTGLLSADASQASSPSMSFEELLLQTVKQKATTKSKRKMITTAEVITREGFLNQQTEQGKHQQAEQGKPRKQQKNKRQKPVEESDTDDGMQYSSSTGEDTPSFGDDSDTEDRQTSKGLQALTAPTTERNILQHLQLVQKGIEVEKYFMAYYKEDMYIGRILEHNSSEKTVKMKFLHYASNGQYKWPKRDDEDTLLQEYLFWGPIQMIGANPFTIPDVDIIRKTYQSIKTKKILDLMKTK